MEMSFDVSSLLSLLVLNESGLSLFDYVPMCLFPLILQRPHNSRVKVLKLISQLKCMERAFSLLWHVRSFRSMLTCDLVAACIVAECMLG